MILRDLGMIGGYAIATRRLAERGTAYVLPYGSHSYRIVKRAIDIGVACIGLLVLALVLLCVTPWVLCEDRGPIFYWQWRVGQHGRPFRMLKLRTMIVGAENHLQQHPHLLVAWKQHGKLVRDPRVTRIGAFLRRTSLDELPQMLNVLRGEMSLVGPRAIQFSEMSAYGHIAQIRLTVPPGLTGLSQISGRADVPYTQRALLDYTYVFHRSLRVDFCILCRTLPAVLRGRGAY